MKNLLFIIVLFFTISSFSQKIKDIDSSKKVIKFLKRNLKKPNTFKSLFESTHIDTFYIQDLNKDSFKDLILNTPGFCLLIINNRNKNYQSKFIYDESSIYQFKYKKMIDINNERVILLNKEIDSVEVNDYKNISVIGNKFFVIDSLKILNNELVDYKKGKKIKKLEIKKIEFRTTSCYGACPIFQIKIDSKLNVTYRGYQYTNSKGVRNFKFSSKEYKELIELIEYSNFFNLKKSFEVNWTDDQTYIIKVTLKNGKEKEIRDYGAQGNVNLKAIYNKILTIYRRLN